MWSSPDCVPPDTVESPLPKRGEGGGGVTLEGEAGGKMGPLVPALLSKLERLLDQVSPPLPCQMLHVVKDGDA